MKILLTVAALLCFSQTPKTIEKRSQIRVLPPGITIVYEPIVLKSGDSLIGNDSSLVLADGAECSVIIVGSEELNPTYETKNVFISGIKIFGNKFAQKHEGNDGDPMGPDSIEKKSYIRNNGITIRRSRDIVIENCEIVGSRSGGIVVEKNSSNIFILKSTMTESYFDGLAAYETHGLFCVDSNMINNDYAGFSGDLNFNSSVFINCSMSNNGHSGVFMRMSQGNVFKDVRFFDNKAEAIFLAESELPNSAAKFNVFYHPIFSGDGGFLKVNDKSCVGNMLFSPVYLNQWLASVIK